MASVVQDRLVEVELVEAPVAQRAPVAEGKAFRAYDPDQVLLMAPSLQDWVPEGHLARFVSDLVDEALDLSAIYASYEEERGFPPYDPRLMVKLLIYGYATGMPSSRKLEERTFSDVAVRFLCADQHPDYRPIARFRKRHLDALAELFVQALRLCRRALRGPSSSSGPLVEACLLPSRSSPVPWPQACRALCTKRLSNKFGLSPSQSLHA